MKDKNKYFMKKNIIYQNILYPVLFLKSRAINNTYIGMKYLKYRTSKVYEQRFQKKLNWSNPKDLNEKINWLKFNSDTRLWTELADKYKVREYVKKKGLDHILVDLYGVWDDVSKIDFESLPESFVLKTNNNTNTNIFIKDKRKNNIEEIKRKINEWIKFSNIIVNIEPHYRKIKPLIIAERYLSATDQDIESNSLIDYKVWCINGEPNFIVVFYDRNSKPTPVEVFDTRWKSHSYYRVYPKNNKPKLRGVPRPKILEEMLDASRILSEGFPQVRIDFYIIKSKLYFGEMTFTSKEGFNKNYSQKFLDLMGEKIDISSF